MDGPAGLGHLSVLFTISGVSSFKHSQMVTTQRVRGNIYLKPAISTLREHE